MKEKKIKYYLGLDLGISSIGWAISSSEKELIDFGVQKWNLPFSLTTTGAKKGTKAEERRGYRSVLRLSNRKKMQKRELKKLLEILPSFAELKKYSSISDWVEDLNKTQNVYDLKYKSINNAEKLSAKELGWVLLNYINKRGIERFSSTEPITSESCIKKLNMKVVKDDENKFSYYKNLKSAIELEEKGINPIDDIIKHKNEKSFTLNDKYEVKNKVYMRTGLKRECSIILDNQKINKEITNRILDLIFTQLKFEDGPDPLHGKNANERKQNRLDLMKILKKEQEALLNKKNKTKEDFKKIKVLRERRIALHHYLPPREQRGKCTYYVDEDRAPESSIIKSLYNYCQESNSDKNKNHLISKDDSKDKFKQIILDFFIKKVTKETCKFWYYLNEELPTNKKMKRLECFKQHLLLNESLSKIALEELKNFVDMLSDFRKISAKTTTEELKNLIRKILIVDTKVFSKFSDFSSLDSQYKSFQPFLKKDIISTQEDYRKNVYARFSTANLSLKVMYEAIIAFLDGKVIGQFLDEIKEKIDYIPLNKMPKTLDETFTITKILNSTSDNSTVFRALSQTRQCIKKIHSYYRKKLNIPSNEFLFDSINIEIGGGFKLTKNEKLEADKQMKDNNKLTKKIQKIISDNGMNDNSNTRDLIKLFLEQGGKPSDNKKDGSNNATCLLTPGMNNISLDDIKFNRVENGHIISRDSGIHNIKNRFIVLKKANRLQGNKLPFEYIKSLNNKEREDEYQKKVTRLYKNNKSKRILLLIKSKNNSLFQEFKEKLSEVGFNDNRYISRVMVSWLTNELVKRDYVLNNKKLIDKNKKIYDKNDEDAYKKWFTLKREEIFRDRINQVSGLTTSFIRKNVLFDKIDKSKRFGNNGVWAFHKKGRIKELTDWDHAIDGIALSCIHNKEALFFYEFYSNALRNYWNTVDKFIREKKLIKEETLIDYKIEVQQYKNGILEYLTKIWRPLNKNPYWYNIVNTYFGDLKRIFDDYLNKPYPIQRPKIPKILCGLFNNFEKKIIDLIPVKLSWYRMNDLSYNFLNEIIKNPSYLKYQEEIFKSLESIVNKDLNDEDFWNSVKDTKKKNNIAKKTYILFNPFFKDYKYNSQRHLNQKDLNKIIHNLNIIYANLNIILDNKEDLIRFKACIHPFNIYELINETITINQETKIRINNFIFTNEIGQFKLQMVTDIYVSDLDLQPRKVVKYYLCGKLKNRKSLMRHENPLRISNDGFPKNNDNTLETIINKNSNNKQDYVEIKKEIRKFRKNPSKLNQIKINKILNKYMIYIDKQGSLWETNSFLGWIVNEKNNQKTRPLTAHEMNHSSLSTLINLNEGEEFIPFGESVYLKNLKLKNHPIQNYPIILKSMKDFKNNLIYITLNGVSISALNKHIFDKKTNLKINEKKNILIKMKSYNFKKTRIDFNGEII